jgi:UDP-glucose 4-epimerase
MTIAGKRILVTGGAGVVGSTIVDHLVRGGAAEVVVLDQFSRGRLANLAWAQENGTVTVIPADLRDTKQLAVAMCGMDIVMHQAAIRITQCAEEPRLALEVMVDATFSVLEAAVSAGVEKVIAASSAAVYGMAEQFPTPEAHHLSANRTLYGACKGFNEALLRSFNEMYGLDYVALRYYNVYGPRMAIRGAHTEVLVRWMERIQAGIRPLILGDGTQTMDFVYVDDVARANVLAAAGDVTDEVFNVASGTETTLNELAHALARAMGSDLVPEYGPERSVNPVPRRVGDPSRAWEKLGFRTEIDLDEGLRRLVEWWRAERVAAEEEVTV